MKTVLSVALLGAFTSTACAASIPVAESGAYFVERGTEPLVARADQYCFEFKSTLNTWYYAFAGTPWGTKKGKGPTNGGTLCVPRSNTGGAMYIGPNPSPGPGSTKFECTIPPSGRAFCDVSLVDGYSLSMNCKADGLSNPLGGPVNLYNTGTPCPDQQGPNCINHHGYDPSQSDVAPFFQKAVQNGNDYCIWKNCNIPSFPSGNKLSCTVSGGR